MNYRYKGSGKILRFDSIPEFKQNKSVSIILPTYNEERTIDRTVREIRTVLNKKNYEIVIVDDNSIDKTPKIIDDYSNGDVTALHRYHKKGIFSAIVDGIKASRSNNVVIMDADFSHPPSMIPEMLKHLDENDIVSCSRFKKKGGVVAPFIPKYSTVVLNLMLRLILSDLGVTDFTGGFHAMKKDKFLALNIKYDSVWGEFDMELFHRAKKRNYKIKEVPFVYKFREEGKSKSDNYLKYAYYYWKMVLKLKLLG